MLKVLNSNDFDRNMPEKVPNHFTNIIPDEAKVLGNQLNSVAAIFRTLIAKDSKGQHCFFQVLVDSLSVVHRTDNLNEFWEFLGYFDSGVHQLEILCYMGRSYRNTRHTIEFAKAKPIQPLNEPVDEEAIDKRVQDEVERWKTEIQLESMQLENDRLRAKTSDQAKQIKALKAELKEVRSKTFDRDNVAIAAVFNLLITRYPEIEKQFPILKQVKGMIGIQPEEPAESESLPAKPETPSES
jgi:hypothetical protein